MEELRIKWRERDLDTLRSEIREDQGVRSALVIFGVLKFVENPLMRVGEPVLTRIVSYWDPKHKVFKIGRASCRERVSSPV